MKIKEDKYMMQMQNKEIEDMKRLKQMEEREIHRQNGIIKKQLADQLEKSIKE